MTTAVALVTAALVDERLELAAQFLGEIFVADRTEEGERRLVGLELRDAARALRQVLLEMLMHLSWEVVLDVVGQEADQIDAALWRNHRNAECRMLTAEVNAEGSDFTSAFDIQQSALLKVI